MTRIRASFAGGFAVVLSVLLPASAAQAWWFGQEKSAPAVLVPAAPVSDEVLSAIPGDRRMQYEGECTLAAMNRAKELQAQEEGFLAANRDYINHCILAHAKADGIAPATAGDAR